MKAVPLQPERFYRPELDLLRLLAFLMVYLHHVISDYFSVRLPVLWSFSRACGAGMQVFFVLSSYLITELMLRERESTGTVRIKAFFTRRILRIWPLYFCFLGGYLLVSLLLPVSRFPALGYLSFVLLSGNWYAAFGGVFTTTIAPLWSISLEEQYYLIWPFIGRSGGRKGLWFLCCLAFLGSYLTLFLLGGRRVPFYAVWMNSFVEFQFFALGAMLALLTHRRVLKPRPATRIGLLLLAVLSIGLAQSKYTFTQDGLPFRSLAPAYLLLGLGVCALFGAVQRLAIPATFGPLLYLGKISYGLYVFHMAAFGIVAATLDAIGLGGISALILRLVGGLLLTIVFAMLSYRLLELPFLRLKRRFELVRTR